MPSPAVTAAASKTTLGAEKSVCRPPAASALRSAIVNAPDSEPDVPGPPSISPVRNFGSCPARIRSAMPPSSAADPDSTSERLSDREKLVSAVPKT